MFWVFSNAFLLKSTLPKYIANYELIKTAHWPDYHPLYHWKCLLSSYKEGSFICQHASLLSALRSWCSTSHMSNVNFLLIAVSFIVHMNLNEINPKESCEWYNWKCLWMNTILSNRQVRLVMKCTYFACTLLSWGAIK